MAKCLLGGAALIKGLSSQKDLTPLRTPRNSKYFLEITHLHSRGNKKGNAGDEVRQGVEQERRKRMANEREANNKRFCGQRGGMKA
jgi:hypothetical protein